MIELEPFTKDDIPTLIGWIDSPEFLCVLAFRKGEVDLMYIKGVFYRRSENELGIQDWRR